MKEMKHTISDLYQMQAMSLELKIRMTEYRIRQWVEEYGEDGVYVSFSGGKDSTVLLHMARNIFPNIKAVFADTGLELPEIRDFVNTFENVDVVKPKMNFKDVICNYGYPFFSKEICEAVAGGRKWVRDTIAKQKGEKSPTKGNCAYGIADLIGVDRRENKDNYDYSLLKKNTLPENSPYFFAVKELIDNADYLPIRVQLLDGKNKRPGCTTKSRYNKERYFFMLYAPFDISNVCCRQMKKNPTHEYSKKNNMNPITAVMANESMVRTQKWLENGCNAFNVTYPISNPMSFWTEQDVLLYAKAHNIELCKVYGDIVYDHSEDENLDEQMTLADLDQMQFGIFDMERPMLKTTGCDRTGCAFCGFGMHIEKRPTRFEKLDVISNPKIRDYCFRGGAFAEDGLWKPDNRGLGYWFAFKWLNIHGGFDIYIPEFERYEKEYGTELTHKYLYGD
jgi:3'-phosphoadenosine 5'-phosphosulfate sulfotransferase (PAPS reductase)/FAD synthetase